MRIKVNTFIPTPFNVMQFKKTILIQILSLLTLELSATFKPIPPILQKLAEIKASTVITYFQPINWFEQDDLPKNFKNEGQHIVKTNDGIFLTIPGTGRVYKCMIQNNKLEYVRIDSTFFGGYNFNSMSFSLNDTIFSFGGEGFWQTNGNLRYFNAEYREWYAIPLCSNIHKNFTQKDLSSYFFHLNTESKSFIIDGSPASPFYLKKQLQDSSFKNKLYQLDLKSGNWIELGRRNFETQISIASINFGVFTKYFLIDVVHNKIYKHNIYPSISEIFGKSNEEEIAVSFYYDSTIYFGSKTRIDSISLKGLVLTDTQELAYIPMEKEGSNVLIYGLYMSLLFIALLIVRFLSKKYKITISRNSTVEPILSSISTTDKQHFSPIKTTARNAFNAHELDFLKFVYEHSKSNKTVGIDEINKNLGIQNKSIEIQKKTRRDMINNINEKWMASMNTQNHILEKNRSAFDKRSFEYFIHPEILSSLTELFS